MRNYKYGLYALLLMTVLFHRLIILGLWIKVAPQENWLGEVEIRYGDDLFRYPSASDRFMVIGIKDSNPVVAYKKDSVITINSYGSRQKFELVRAYCEGAGVCVSWSENAGNVDVNYMSFEGRLDGASGDYHLYGFTEQDVYMEYHGESEVVDTFMSSIWLFTKSGGVRGQG